MLSFYRRLFREIQDKYKLTLTRDAVLQFTHNDGLSQSVFIRVQCHALSRLRAYWIPRYLLHKDYLNELGFV